MSAEFDQLVAEFEAFQSRLTNVDDRFAGLADMQSKLAELEVSVTAPDRSVTVVAGVGGAVRDIRFTEAAVHLGVQRLGATVMSALQEAVAEAARRHAVIVAEYAGDDAPVLEQVLQTQAEVTGVPIEELRARAAAETGPAPAGEEDSIVFRDTPLPPQAAGTASDADEFLRTVFDEEDDGHAGR